MKIENLIKDIYDVVGTKGWFTDEVAKGLSGELIPRLDSAFGQQDSEPRLRLSQMGPRCPRSLWASVHAPLEAEPLPPWATVKYTYGHIIEALVINLAKVAGHEVTGEQDELVVDGVKGHRDCVIDGFVVDVKSCSSRHFQKIKEGGLRDDDPFGYLAQLDGYLAGSLEDPLVRVKDRGYILAVDKTLGHMCLYEHKLRENFIRERIRAYRTIVEHSTPPECTCETIPDGKSGNQKLGLKASYNSYKHFCFPNLRTFIYASGPVYLTKVIRKPDVLEVDRYGKPVYNYA